MDAMQCPSGRLNSSDGTELFWRGWLPAAPAAALLFVHGLAEHSGRYEATARHFAGSGLACYALDLRGHGLSGGRRVHVRRFEDYLEDVRCAAAFVRGRTAGLPLFLVGHSMGGLTTLLYVLRRPEDVAGAVVSSPLLAPHPSAEPPALIKAAARVLSKVVPGLLMATKLDATALSRDKGVVDAYLKDPLVTCKASPRWYTATVAAGAQALAFAPTLAVPLLLMQSGGDRLVDPEATRRWAEAAPRDRVDFVEWEGLYHEMFNEPERERVYARVREWLETRLGRSLPAPDAARNAKHG